MKDREGLHYPKNKEPGEYRITLELGLFGMPWTAKYDGKKWTNLPEKSKVYGVYHRIGDFHD